MIKKFKSDKNTEFEISFDVNDNKFITQTKTTELYLIKKYENVFDFKHFSQFQMFANYENMEEIFDELKNLINNPKTVLLEYKDNLKLILPSPLKKFKDIPIEIPLLNPDEEIDKKMVIKKIMDLDKENKSFKKEIESIKKENETQKSSIINLHITITNLKNENSRLTKQIKSHQKLFENLYLSNFNIEKFNLLKELNSNTEQVWSLILLHDGRFAASSKDKTINIYNSETFVKEIEIKDQHTDGIRNIKQLYDFHIVSCSFDFTIKIFNISGKSYSLVQTLQEHTDKVRDIIELKNLNLVSVSSDKTMKIWHKKDNKYKMQESVHFEDLIRFIYEVKENEVVLYLSEVSKIVFYNLDKKSQQILDNLELAECEFCMLNEKTLYVSGEEIIYLVDVNNYSILNSIKCGSNMSSILKLSNDIIITGDQNYLYQWKFEENNLNLIYTKKNCHLTWIRGIIKLHDGNLVTCSDDKTIKIWEY